MRPHGLNCANYNQTSSFKQIAMRGEFHFGDYCPSPAFHYSITALNSQHFWEHLHLREQLLNNEAHQIKINQYGKKNRDYIIFQIAQPYPI